MTHFNYIVFVLSNGRPKTVPTIKTLENSNITNYKIICDDLDPFLPTYKAMYGDKVIVFNKKEYMESTDPYSNKAPTNIVMYARNAVFDIAKELGYDYFVVLDDDYKEFVWRWVEDGKLKQENVDRRGILNELFEAHFQFLEDADADVVAMAQTGDLIGGAFNQKMAQRKLTRKAMNVFFFKTERRVYFEGAINEDVNMYVLGNLRGMKIFTPFYVFVSQFDTQQFRGGLTETYLQLGTYVKSFYTIIARPSSVKIDVMGNTHLRFHHRINWNSVAPKILDSKYKK